MSKCLFQFDEYGKGMGFPSIKDSFEDSPYEGQDKIIEYLKNNGAEIIIIDFHILHSKFMVDL